MCFKDGSDVVSPRTHDREASKHKDPHSKLGGEIHPPSHAILTDLDASTTVWPRGETVHIRQLSPLWERLSNFRESKKKKSY